MCSTPVSRRAYILVQVVMFISMYAIPYLVLANVRDISLFLFWSTITLVVCILSIAWLKILQEKFER